MKKILTVIFSLFTSAAWAGNVYDFSFDGLDGKPIDLEKYRGQVVMVVNTASKCGFTPQYADLEQLYTRFKDQGFVIIGVPSDAYGQELANGKEIEAFLKEKYNVTFPMANMTEISGENAHPFYKWAAENAGFFERPKWNFHKYVFDREGNFAGSFSSITSPMNKKVITAIGLLVNEK